jgi:hypothetical protein
MSLGLLVLAGCPMTPTFTTGYEIVGQPVDPRSDATLAVRRFADQRPPRTYTTQGRLFMTYIPFLPYVSLPFERMDENVRVIDAEIAAEGGSVAASEPMPRAPEFGQYEYSASVARALADDLREQGLFRDVQYVGDTPDINARYVLDGVVLASPLDIRITSFFLGAPGVLLWILPIPIGKVSGAVNVSLTLTDTTSADVVWHDTLSADVSRLVYFYTSDVILYGTSVMSYQMPRPPSDARVDRRSIFAWNFEALRRAMDQARPRLTAALAAR